ncbi:hypothetical protein ACFUN7_14670 [Streptomyces sp. NPDC057236]|uniref:hypothetical protein n=1 Tax=Streptomyces sp. NPDC057236 TaxID=3346059 RepID=UPI003641F10D
MQTGESRAMALMSRLPTEGLWFSADAVTTSGASAPPRLHEKPAPEYRTLVLNGSGMWVPAGPWRMPVHSRAPLRVTAISA